MDSLQEKKWFIYVDDHHEGPFSIKDIQEKMSQGIVSTDSFVWAEGMADWQSMKETPGLEVILSEGLGANSQNSNPPSEEKTGDLSPEDLKQAQEQAHAQAQEHEQVHKQGDVTSEGSFHDDAADEVPVEEVPESRPRTLFNSRKILLLLLLGSVIYAHVGGYTDFIFKNSAFPTFFKDTLDRGTDLIRPYLLEVAARAPFLEAWISPLPELEGVSPAEMEELKKAAQAKSGPGSSNVAMALSQKDLLYPSFYLASNVPGNAGFQIYLMGVSHTLLNHTYFNTRMSVSLHKKLGQSLPARMPDGKPIPRGEYFVFVLLDENQSPEMKSMFTDAHPASIQLLANLPADFPKEAKILTSKSYFLGGKKDATYLSRLKDFHDKLRIKASNELGDLKQFAITLENQLTSTLNKFNLYSKGSGPARQRKAWEAFHGEWIKLQSQLHDIFQRWTSQSLQNDFFYPSLFTLLQSTNQSVERVHAFQHDYFVGNISDPRAIHIQMGEAASSAQNAISLLKTRIDQTEKLPATPNGMPQREGL